MGAGNTLRRTASHYPRTRTQAMHHEHTVRVHARMPGGPCCASRAGCAGCTGHAGPTGRLCRRACLAHAWEPGGSKAGARRRVCYAAHAEIACIFTHNLFYSRRRLRTVPSSLLSCWHSSLHASNEAFTANALPFRLQGLITAMDRHCPALDHRCPRSPSGPPGRRCPPLGAWACGTGRRSCNGSGSCRIGVYG